MQFGQYKGDSTLAKGCANRLTRCLAAVALALGGSLATAGASQAAVVTGSLVETVHFAGSEFNAGTTVDSFKFSVIADGLVTFDALSVNTVASPDPPALLDVDVMIWVFEDNGSSVPPYDVTNLVAENDDDGCLLDFVPQFGAGDGSLHCFDSFMEAILAAGDYILAVGSCCDFGLDDNFLSDMADGAQFEEGATLGEFVRTDLHPYRIAITGNVSVPGAGPGDVPEPATLVLVGLGLAGLAYARRRRV